jgi:hypothetical protein
MRGLKKSRNRASKNKSRPNKARTYIGFFLLFFSYFFLPPLAKRHIIMPLHLNLSEGGMPAHPPAGERGNGGGWGADLATVSGGNTNKPTNSRPTPHAHARPPLQTCRRPPESGNQVIPGWVLGALLHFHFATITLRAHFHFYYH